jgi:hypothetical protein
MNQSTSYISTRSFNSNASFNVLFAEHDGTKAAAQINAFGDTWEWNADAARACQDVIEMGAGHFSARKFSWQLVRKNPN